MEKIYPLTEQFPEQKRREVQSFAESYARIVVEEGWPMMQRGQVSVRAREIGDELGRSVMYLEPGAGAEQELQTQDLTLIQDLGE